MYFAGVIAIVGLFLPLGDLVLLNRTMPSGMLSVCPNSTVIFTCRVTGSSFLEWISTEYIGSNQVLFATSSIEGTTVDVINGGVAELTQNSGNVLESELRIRANMNSTIRCQPDNANDGVTENLTVYNDIPGSPTGVEAAEIPVSEESCAILVNWNPPTDTSPEDISHYIIRNSLNGDDVETTATSTLTAFQLNQCTDNLFVNVTTVDRCEREGPSSSDVMPNLLPPINLMADNSTPISPITDTTTSLKPDTESDTTAPIGTNFQIVSQAEIALIVVVIIIAVVVAVSLIVIILRVRRLKRKIKELEKGDVQKRKAVIPLDTVVPWRGQKVIYIEFLDPDDLLANWTIKDGEPMNKGTVIEYANTWSKNGGGKIPSFVEAEGGKTTQIRVGLNDKGICSSELGKGAQNVPKEHPTMNLDLRNGCPSNEVKKYLIIHMFGHALGLSYKHQRLNFWKCIKPFINTDKMRKDLELTEEQFAIEWPEVDSEDTEEYDPDSVMHQWFKFEWLIRRYSNKKNVERDRENNILNDKASKALLGVHEHRWNPPTKPSDLDIQLMNELYDGDDGEDNTDANNISTKGELATHADPNSIEHQPCPGGEEYALVELSGSVDQDPLTIQHQEGAGGDLDTNTVADEASKESSTARL